MVSPVAPIPFARDFPRALLSRYGYIDGNASPICRIGVSLMWEIKSAQICYLSPGQSNGQRDKERRPMTRVTERHSRLWLAYFQRISTVSGRNVRTPRPGE